MREERAQLTQKVIMHLKYERRRNSRLKWRTGKTKPTIDVMK